MRTRAAVLIAMLLMACAAAPAAASAVEWSISTETVTGKLDATSTASHLIDETTGEKLNCGESTSEGELKEGVVKEATIGNISMPSWNKGTDICAAEGLFSFEFKLTTNTLSEPWPVEAVGEENSGDLIWIEIHIHKLQLTSSVGCDFEVGGLMLGLYHNAAKSLTIGKPTTEAGEKGGFGTTTLTVSNEKGCLGTINNGDKGSLEILLPPAGNLQIKKNWLGVKNVSGAGEAHSGIRGTCEFAAEGEKCQVQFENISASALEITKQEELGGPSAKSRYAVTKVECKVKVIMVTEPCTDELKVIKYSAGAGSNDYCLIVKDTGTGEPNVTCAILRM